MTQQRVRQLRVVVEAADYDEAVRFFRDVLGMSEELAYAEGGDDRVVILDAGRATLEIGTPAHIREVDRVEGATVPSPAIRLAFEVDDAPVATEDLAAAGGEVVGEPVTTPWRSVNSRIAAPAGLQITLFQEAGS
ncbi:VOC family protein [Georgenia sp. H159]|uniref:VOC family protein n=1 Tax=Georgenia sp. H159 TaxID=3076115 RepID=UPI002D790329|nr:VOC family protein [Georgenia sp. H159]